MINQYEVCMYLQETLPGFEQKSIYDKGNPYIAMHKLLEITSEKIKEHNYYMVKKCFEVADKLYEKGNNMVKSAVENAYVYSFSAILQFSEAERNHVFAIMPMSLYTIYIHQIHQGGC